MEDSKQKPKKRATATKWFYALPDSTLTIDGRTYKLGDSVDDWTEAQREKHRFKIAQVVDA